MRDQNHLLLQKNIINNSVCSVIYWKKIFLYFWVFSIVGHLIEIVWSQINHIITGNELWRPIILTFTPAAAPYGLGVVGIILFVWPFMKRHKFNIFVVFLLSVLVTTIIEYLCAVVIVSFVGSNDFWNYNDQFMNLNGFVCLESSILFGINSVIFLYLIYPFCEKILNRFTKKQISTVFWFLFISYSVDLIYVFIRYK